LRRQYERLYPTPDWANLSARSTTRRRKSDACQNASSDDSDNDLMDTDGEEETMARPLGKLLQSISDLTRDEERPVKKRKLRQDVIDIQRTKDVGGIQPVSLSISLTCNG
jgi:U3 small nucleolar RNA-associated protein 18